MYSSDAGGALERPYGSAGSNCARLARPRIAKEPTAHPTGTPPYGRNRVGARGARVARQTGNSPPTPEPYTKPDSAPASEPSSRSNTPQRASPQPSRSRSANTSPPSGWAAEPE